MGFGSIDCIVKRNIQYPRCFQSVVLHFLYIDFYLFNFLSTLNIKNMIQVTRSKYLYSNKFPQDCFRVNLIGLNWSENKNVFIFHLKHIFISFFLMALVHEKSTSLF